MQGMMTLNILFSVITCLLILFLWKRKEKTKEFRYYHIIILLLALVFLFLLTYKLGSVPRGLHVDEAGMAYDAFNLVKYGVDRFLYPNPVYFINFGGGQNALYTYLAAFMIKIFGYSITMIRIPAVLLSILSAFCLVFMVKKEKGKLASGIILFLLCVLPFSIMHSRWALESYLLFPMSIISIFCLYQAFSKRKKIWFLLSGLSFGFTLYTYAIAYLILPIFLAVILIYAIIQKKISCSEFFCLAIPLSILAFPLILMLLVNNEIIPEIVTPILSIPKMLVYRGSEFSLSNINNNWFLLSVLFSYDGLIYNSFPQFGTMYYFGIPLCLYGFILVVKNIVKVVKKKEISLDFIIFIFFISTYLVAITLEVPNINRINAIYFPFIYFTSLGICSLISKSNWSIFLILAMYLIMFSLFLYTYYIEYPKKVHDACYFVSQDNLEDAITFANRQHKDKVYILDEDKYQPYIYTVLALRMDLYNFNKEKVMDNTNVIQLDNYYFRLGDIEEDNIYIFLKEDKIPKKFDKNKFSCKKFGSIIVYY